MTTLAGWGAAARVECDERAPELRPDIGRGVDAGGTIARGLGRSYGDAATNDHRRVLTLDHYDRYVAFDEAEGVLECEAGVSLGQIIRDFGPRGWFPMITPGTKFVTVGGCIANDVHGKAHHVQGSFERSVLSFRILLADRTVVTASPTENRELFYANFGGMGLLGVILTVRLQLRRVSTTWFTQKVFVARDLSEMMDLMVKTDAQFPYSVANINPLVTGAGLGQGVLTCGDHASSQELPKDLEPLKISGPPLVSVPFELPDLVFNPLSIRILHFVIDQVLKRGAPFAHYGKFFYPLDAIGHWNRGYGRRGFTQYQFVIPFDDAPRQLRAILEVIAASGNFPSLNVLKRLGKPGNGPLSFPMEGYTLAIDFPIRAGTPALLKRLDAMVLDAGGRIYLGKDNFLDADTFAKMYPRLPEFLATKARVDPTGVFTSDLARRLRIG